MARKDPNDIGERVNKNRPTKRAFWLVVWGTGLAAVGLVLAPFAGVTVPLGVIGGVVGTGVIFSMVLYSRSTSGLGASGDNGPPHESSDDPLA